MILRPMEHQKCYYSQFGQDGVLEYIFENIKPASKTFVEFGSSGTDEGQGNTIWLRKQHGWTGWLMGSEKNDKSIYPVHIEKINHLNVENVFHRLGIPQEFGLLSIDIDGQDYWVWKAIEYFRPNVVCIEFNVNFRLDESVSVPCDPSFRYGGNMYYGASLSAMASLGARKDYWPVAVVGSDIVFASEETLSRHDLANHPFEEPDYNLHHGTHRITIPMRKQLESYEWVEV